MPLAGGGAAKFGLRYEGRWTVLCLIDVMEEKANSIRLEPPGDEGDGIEFWLRKEEWLECHQVKRQQSKRGDWTLADLNNNQVLAYFWEKLLNPKSSCHFVSTQAASSLDELTDRARRASSWNDFQVNFLGKSTHAANFDDLVYRWGGCSEEAAYQALKRIRVRTIDEETLHSFIESRIGSLVDGDSANAADVLAEFALEKVNHELSSFDIWNHLELRGFKRRAWGKDPTVVAALTDATKRYLQPHQAAVIGGKMFPRDESRKVLELLSSAEGEPTIFLVGEAGAGKSETLVQIVEALLEKSIPVLCVRADRLDPSLLPDDIGKQMGLPASPVKVLAAVANGRDCVLVIDQLDAVSLASGRNPKFFDCIWDLKVQARAHPKMRLLLGCRKFDLDNDHRFRRLSRGSGVREISISRISQDTVKSILNDLGFSVDRFSARQLDLLSIPLHLSLLSESGLVKNKNFDFESSADLYRAFWSYKQSVIGERLGHPVEWTKVIDILCKYMSENQVLSAPEDILDEFSADAQAMASEHVLVRDGRSYAFFHEGFFDYAFARFFTRSGQRLLSFLLNDEQHLFRRAQVRQILLYERQVNPSIYLEEVQGLLGDRNIRFHIKQVVLSLLASLSDPSEAEWNIVSPFLG